MRLKTMPAENATESQSDLLDQDCDEVVESQVQDDSASAAVKESAVADVADTVASDSSPDPSISEDLYWAEVKLAGAMADVERKRSDLEDQIEEAKECVSKVQSDLKEQESALSELRGQLKTETDELLGLARKLMRVTSGKQMPADDDSSEENAEDGWRLALTFDLMQGVKGLSKKKLELLVDEAPTAGDLQDLRADASQQHKQYHEVMPKGIGAGVCQVIEDRLLEHVTKWMRQSQDPARSKLAEDLLNELRSVAGDWNAEDCLPKETDDEHVHAGYTAFNEGRLHSEFISDDRSKSRQWMTGWVGAERLKQLSA